LVEFHFTVSNRSSHACTHSRNIISIFVIDINGSYLYYLASFINA
jgi:hypothetical protein